MSKRRLAIFGPRYWAVLFLLILVPCISPCWTKAAWSDEKRTSQDVAAEQELRQARPEFTRMGILLQNEFARVLSDTPSAPSPELAKIMQGAERPQPNLSDAKIPLRVRMIDWERSNLISAVEWARGAATHCDNPDFSPAQLVDPSFRRHMHTVIECRQQELDRFQVGLHKLNKANESTVLELKLPPFTEAAMLSQFRAATAQQDAEIEPLFKGRRILLQSIDDLFNFVDAHSKEVHFAGNQLNFDNAADSKTAADLVNKFLAAGSAAQ